MGEIQNSWNQRHEKESDPEPHKKAEKRKVILYKKIQRSVTIRSMNLGQSICTRIRIFCQIFGLDLFHNRILKSKVHIFIWNIN